jgi:hypothetical protein
MIDNAKIEEATLAYLHSYNVALRETRNPNLAVQAAMAVVFTVMNKADSKPQEPSMEQANPLAILFGAAMKSAAEKNQFDPEDDE